MNHKISDDRNLELYGTYIITIIITLHTKLLLDIMLNVHIKKHTIAWHVIPISRCPDQASCYVHMKCVYYSSYAICMYTSCQN